MAISYVLVLSISAAVLTGSSRAQISQGYATYSNGNGGVCSGTGGSLPSVSMNAAQFANGAACGQCIQITANGNGAGTTPVSTAPYVAQINNVCPQCSYGDIDLQESGNGKYGISWSFVACPGSGRKLLETTFHAADKTVYTGFAHKGLTSDKAVFTGYAHRGLTPVTEDTEEPQSVQSVAAAPELPAELVIEEQLEQEIADVLEPESIVVAPQTDQVEGGQQISSEANPASQEAIAVSEEAFEDIQGLQDVVKTSRRLLMSK